MAGADRSDDAAYLAEARDRWRSAGATAGGRRALLRAMAAGAGIDLDGPDAGTDLTVAPLPVGSNGPDLIGRLLEALVDAGDRRRGGVHHTPRPIADGLVALALGPAGDGASTPSSVCDPAVGGGAFLLAAARARHAAGAEVLDVVAGSFGVDTDPLAVDVARAALRWWARDHGAAEAEVTALLAGRIRVGDGLSFGRGSWPDAPPGGFDLVIGNPPFLNQLETGTARSDDDRQRLVDRFGAAAAGYVDAAGLFLLAASELAAPGAAVSLVLPESFLGARDAGPVRAVVASRAELTDLWVAGERVFGAEVRVCAPVLVMHAHAAVNGSSAGGGSSSGTDGPGGAASVRLWRGPGFDPVGCAARSSPARDPFQGLVAQVYGTPRVELSRGAGTLRDLATATAGFRDQFYGLAPHVVEAEPGPVGAGMARLVTSGAVDPLWCGWGVRPVRFAGQRWVRPVVDRRSLAGADPRLARWVADRLVPKILVATQTRVIEAAVDVEGELVPSVPVIAVAADPSDLWAVVAVLLAPAASAWALQQAGGTALTADAVKLSAKQLLDIRLPSEGGAWSLAAAGLASGELEPEPFAALMAQAYGLPDADPVTAWWLARLPSWRGRSHGAG